MCAHGREIGRSAEDAVHRPTDNESVAAAYVILCDLGNEGCHVQGKVYQIAFSLEIARVQDDGS